MSSRLKINFATTKKLSFFPENYDFILKIGLFQEYSHFQKFTCSKIHIFNFQKLTQVQKGDFIVKVEDEPFMGDFQPLCKVAYL